VVIYAGWVERGVYSDNAKFKETGLFVNKKITLARYLKYFSYRECLTKLIKKYCFDISRFQQEQ
jgi:hypothetical protein